MHLHYHSVVYQLNYILENKMTTLALQYESTLTDRYQTTVPAHVRAALRLEKRDKIKYTIQPDGHAHIQKVEEHESDPVVEQFLGFLVKDITQNPQNLKTLSPDLVSYLQSLISDVEIDLDAPLSDEDG